MSMTDPETLRAVVLDYDNAFRRLIRATRLADDEAAAAASLAIQESTGLLAESEITNADIEAARLAYEACLADHRRNPTPESRAEHRANAQALTDLRRAQRIVRDAPPPPTDPNDGGILVSPAPTKEG